MKRKFKAIMAFLTAVTMTASAMSVTAYAEENNTTLLSESTFTEGVFLEDSESTVAQQQINSRAVCGTFENGATYTCYPNAMLRIYGSSFSPDEFYKLTEQYTPKYLILSDADISAEENKLNEWFQRITDGELGFKGVVAMYKENSSILDKYNKMIDSLATDDVTETDLRFKYKMFFYDKSTVEFIGPEGVICKNCHYINMSEMKAYPNNKGILALESDADDSAETTVTTAATTTTETTVTTAATTTTEEQTTPETTTTTTVTTTTEQQTTPETTTTTTAAATTEPVTTSSKITTTNEGVLTDPNWLVGDVDHNGILDNGDPLYMCCEMANFIITHKRTPGSDFNGDGTANIRDAVDLFKELYKRTGETGLYVIGAKEGSVILNNWCVLEQSDWLKYSDSKKELKVGDVIATENIKIGWSMPGTYFCNDNTKLKYLGTISDHYSGSIKKLIVKEKINWGWGSQVFGSRVIFGDSEGKEYYWETRFDHLGADQLTLNFKTEVDPSELKEGDALNCAVGTAEYFINGKSETKNIVIFPSDNYLVSEFDRGDINNDGKVNARDCALIAKSLASGTELPENADFNMDGKVNIRDAAAAAAFLSNIRQISGKNEDAAAVKSFLGKFITSYKMKADISLNDAGNGVVISFNKNDWDVYSFLQMMISSCGISRSIVEFKAV